MFIHFLVPLILPQPSAPELDRQMPSLREHGLALSPEQLGSACPTQRATVIQTWLCKRFLAEQPQQMLDLNSSKVRRILSPFPGVP